MFGRFWNGAAVDAVGGLPAVVLLAGDDKDFGAGAGLAEAGFVEIGDFGEAINGRRRQADVGDIASAGAATATGCLREYHDVRAGIAGQGQKKADAAGVVGDHEAGDGIGAKGRAQRRFQGLGAADAGAHGVDGFVELLAGEGPGGAEPRIAANLRPGQAPAVLLFLAQAMAEGVGMVTEGGAHELARFGFRVARNDEFAQAEAVA